MGAIITKLPPSWKEYGKNFLHKSKDISLKQIQKHLCIEEESRLHHNMNYGSYDVNVNFVEGQRSQSKNANFQAKKNG